MIDKQAILQFLKDTFIFDKTFGRLEDYDFDDVNQSVDNFFKIFTHHPFKAKCGDTDAPPVTAPQQLRNALGSLGRTGDPDTTILEFIKGHPGGEEYDIHQWHLKRFRPEVADLLLPELRTMPDFISKAQDFREIRDEVIKRKKLVENQRKKEGKSKILFGDTCVYDFSLRGAYNHFLKSKNNKILPKDFVYFHSKPAETLKWLKKLDAIEKPDKKYSQPRQEGDKPNRYSIHISAFKKWMEKYKLESIDFEHFLCVMHDPIQCLDESFVKKEKQ